MRNTHEPHDDFVERLQSQLTAEVRRRNHQGPVRWPMRSRLTLAAAALSLAVVSMGVGGAVVAAAYQAQTNDQRNQLVAMYQQRVDLARQRLQIAKAKLDAAQARVATGTAAPVDVMPDEIKVAEAESQIASLEVQLQEVRLTGHEPQDSVVAPLVSGRDFVTERWRFDMRVPMLSMQLEKSRLEEVKRRVNFGIAPPIEISEARVRIGELEAAIAGFDRNMAIRQRFLKKEIDAAEAQLRVLESEAELRQTTVKQKIDQARLVFDAVSRKFAVGLAQQVEVAEASLTLRELETELAKIELDLAMVRTQLTQKRGK